MEVKVENTGPIGRIMNVSVPAERLETEIASRLKRMVKTVRIPGFRPGKAPYKVVESKYRAGVVEEVSSSVIESTLREALESNDLKLAVQPDLDIKPYDKQTGLEYTATFDVHPEFKKLDLEGEKVDLPETEVGDADIDRTLETMRKQQISWDEVDRKSELGDRVIIDFVGSIDGEEFEGGKAEGYALVIGEGQLLPDFEKGVTGLKPKENKAIKIKFPKDYAAEELAGKKADFDITVQSVSEATLPEVDEAFAESFGVKGGDVAALRDEVKSNLERELDAKLRAMTKERVFEAILKANELVLPGKMVEQEIDSLIDRQQAYVKNMAAGAKLPDLDRENFREDAERRVGLGLIMMELIHRKNLRADADRVRSRVEDMSSGYEKPEEFVSWYYADKQRMSQIESVVLEEQVVDLLLESADTKKEKVSFEDIMYGASA